MKRSRTKLTDTSIARLRAPDPSGRQVLHWDSELPGFGVLCSGVSKSRSYVVQRDVDGKSRRITIGAVGEITLDKAREEAGGSLHALRRGIDPKNRDANITLRATLDAYLKAKNLRPASVRTYGQISRYLEDWLDLPLRQIDKDMVERRHKTLVEDVGGASADLAMRVLRVLWNFSAARVPRGVPEMPPNPMARLKGQWFNAPRRDRMVDPKRLPEFYAAVMALRNPIVRDFLVLLLFTGLRKGEAARLRWDDVDLAQKILHLPATSTKAKKKLDLPICDHVHDMLVARRALGNTGYVFPSYREGKPISDTSLPFATIAKTTGIVATAHDLRRGFATIADSIDVGWLVLKRLLNHAPPPDVTAGYVLLTPDRLRGPVDCIGAEIVRLCAVRPVGGKNVRRLGRAKT